MKPLLVIVMVVFAVSWAIHLESGVKQPSVQVWVFVSDPDAAMKGKSTCGPCNRLCLDLQKYKTSDGRFIIGKENGAMFHLIKSAPGKPVPRIRFPGQNEITGYSGGHEMLVRMHPKSRSIKKR